MIEGSNKAPTCLNDRGLGQQGILHVAFLYIVLKLTKNWIFKRKKRNK